MARLGNRRAWRRTAPRRAGRAVHLEHEAPCASADGGHYTFEAREHGRAVCAVEHQRLRRPVASDVPSVRLGHAGSREFRPSFDLLIRLLVPGLHFKDGGGMAAHDDSLAWDSAAAASHSPAVMKGCPGSRDPLPARTDDLLLQGGYADK